MMRLVGVTPIPPQSRYLFRNLMSGVSPPTPPTSFLYTSFAPSARYVLRGGSCMLQEPHGEYQHRLASIGFQTRRATYPKLLPLSMSAKAIFVLGR